MYGKNLNHLMDGPIRLLLEGMAKVSTEYDGTLESFKDEFKDIIAERPDVLGQNGGFHTLIRENDKNAIDHIAERIKQVQKTRQNTIMLDHYDELMNILTRAYGFHLVTCPECGTINSRTDDRKKKCSNLGCDISFQSSEAPDLFF